MDRRRTTPRADRRRSAPPGPALRRVATTPVVGLALLSTAGLAAFDLVLTGRLSMFFDLGFVLVGLTAALVVHRPGFFAVGVLPPLLLGSVMAVLALLMPSALTSTPLAFVSSWLTGLAHHAVTLVSTHIAVLAIVGLRAAQRAPHTPTRRSAQRT
ncbi:MAG: DUF6542 domain-containing protein [Nocardioidaceae bacterium]